MLQQNRDLDYVYLSTRVQAMERGLLTRERMERMLDAPTLDTAAKVLTECGYPDLPRVTPDAGEEILEQCRGRLMADLEGEMPQPEVLAVFQLQNDYHNAKVLVKAEALGGDWDRLLLRGGRYDPRQLAEDYRREDLSAYGESFCRGIARAREVLGATGDPQQADFVLDRACFEDLTRTARDSGSEFLQGYAALLIDAANLRAAVRASRLGKGADFLLQALVEGGNVPVSALAGARGYESTAFHPYQSSGWNRPIVYSNMRFDHQLYQEDVEDPYLIRRYISDQSDYEKLYEITDADQGDKTFVFNVTMQNHSSYAQGWNNLEKTVTLPEEQRAADTTAEQYLSLMKASDDALADLIGHYSQSQEPTMIVFFGDHQPPLKNAFYELLYGKPLSERTTQEVLKQYATPFFIWTNYDIEEQQDVVISPNFLGVLTAQMAGLPLTGYMNFLSQLYEVLPVITPVGLISAQGEYLTEDQLNAEQQEWLMTYETLNYCGMVDLFDEARPMYCLD